MILFVFEGDEREPHIYKTIEKLYFQRVNDNIICSFGNNIYELYNKMIELNGDGDIVSVLKERLTKVGDNTLDGIKSSDFSEIYLFFDYDFQNSQLPLDEINHRVDEMLSLFNEETDSGKLYINYPMIESIRYVKELPDDEYVNYAVTRNDCRDFKRLSSDFCFYDSLDFILFRDGEKPSKERYTQVRENWTHLRNMNVCKANRLVSGIYDYPARKSDINQSSIFTAQKHLYVNSIGSVAILNSFPLFIYDYLK